MWRNNTSFSLVTTSTTRWGRLLGNSGGGLFTDCSSFFTSRPDSTVTGTLSDDAVSVDENIGTVTDLSPILMGTPGRTGPAIFPEGGARPTFLQSFFKGGCFKRGWLDVVNRDFLTPDGAFWRAACCLAFFNFWLIGAIWYGDNRVCSCVWMHKQFTDHLQST